MSKPHISLQIRESKGEQIAILELPVSVMSQLLRSSHQRLNELLRDTANPDQDELQRLAITVAYLRRELDRKAEEATPQREDSR